MDRRDFTKYAALTGLLTASGLITSCSGLTGKPPSNPKATEEDVMRHFAYNSVEDTLDSLGDRVTYFSNKEEFDKHFYQEQLPPEERQNVMAGLYWHQENTGIYSQRNAALTWFIANEFPDLKVMCNIIGYKWNERGNDQASDVYNVDITPALFFGEVVDGEVQRHQGTYITATETRDIYKKNGLNRYGGPPNFNKLEENLEYLRENISEELGIERRPWEKAYKKASIDDTLKNPSRRELFEGLLNYMKA